MSINENKKAREYVGCLVYALIATALLVICIALWIAFGPVVGLLSIAAVFFMGAAYLFLVLAADAKRQKTKNDQ